MENSNEVLQSLICGLSDDDHFVKDPIILSKCGHCVCKSCIPDRIGLIRCNCGALTRRNIINWFKNRVSQPKMKLFQNHFSSLYDEIEKRFNEDLKKLKSKYTFV